MTFYTIIESCKLNGLDPRNYIEEMAMRSARQEKLETPFNYAERKIKEADLMGDIFQTRTDFIFSPAKNHHHGYRRM